MSKSNDTDNFVYNANGVPFKIWRTRKRTRRCDEGKFYWLLEDYSTGKRRILNHKTREAAKCRADLIRTAMAKGQANRLALTNGQWQDFCCAWEEFRAVEVGGTLSGAVGEWAEATRQKLASNINASLPDMVTYFIDHAGQAPKHVPEIFSKAATAYQQSKVNSGKSAQHCKNIKCRMNRLAAVLPKDTLTDALTAGQLEQVVQGFNLSAKTCNEYRIMLANFFKWAAKQNPPQVPIGYNPAQAMDRQRIVQGEVEFVRVGELKKIIAALPDSRPDLLPLVVLVCFSGLRPSEATRLDWSEVGTDFIRLPGTKSKTGRSRQIPICENLKKWLEQWRKPTGPVCEKFSLVHVNPAIFRASGVRIAHDALRHGYATHRQKIINNLALLAEEMGNSVSVCRRHYANPFVLPDEAADWFSIAPTTSSEVSAAAH